jgi:hypothetical protein
VRSSRTALALLLGALASCGEADGAREPSAAETLPEHEPEAPGSLTAAVGTPPPDDVRVEEPAIEESPTADLLSALTSAPPWVPIEDVEPFSMSPARHGARVGIDGAMDIRAVASGGGWVLLCRQEDGEHLARGRNGAPGGLIPLRRRGTRVGEVHTSAAVLPVERLIADSPRWVALETAGGVVVLDEARQRRLNLGARTVTHAAHVGEHLLLLTEHELLLVDVGGARIAASPFSGAAVGVGLDVSGAVLIDLASDDELGGRRAFSSGVDDDFCNEARSCIRFHSAAERHVLNWASGALAPLPLGSRIAGTALLYLSAGALMRARLLDGAPVTDELAPASCTPEVLATSSTGETVVVRCNRGESGTLGVFSAGSMHSTDVPVGWVADVTERAITLGGPPVLVDLDDGEIHLRLPGNPAHTAGHWVVTSRALGEVGIVDLNTMEERVVSPVSGEVRSVRGDFALVGESIVELRTGRVRHPGRWIGAVSDSGLALVGPDEHGGPYRWTR